VHSQAMTDVILQSSPARSMADVTLSEPPKLTIRMAPFRTVDLPAVLDLLARCTRQSLFHRFHGFTGGESWAYTLVTQPADWTSCAWADGRCVGVAGFGGAPETNPELGVLVEDAWQRQGVGRALVDRLVDTMWKQGLKVFCADLLGDDAFLLSLLRRYGALETQLNWGVYSVRVALSRVAMDGQP
jgi:GNAT superfamily N-acetyltransferase